MERVSNASKKKNLFVKYLNPLIKIVWKLYCICLPNFTYKVIIGH